MDKRYHQMTPAERIADRIAKNRAIEQQISQRTANPKPSPRQSRVFFSGTEPRGFTHSDVFPPIFSVIEALCRPDNKFVEHRQIVLAICDDAGFGTFLDEIVLKDPAGHSRDWWADSMVKWFSQTFTVGTNPYAESFERDNTRPYRYRLRK